MRFIETPRVVPANLSDLSELDIGPDHRPPSALVIDDAAYDLVRWGPTATNWLPLRLLRVRTAAAANFHHHLATLTPHAGSLAKNLGENLDARTRLARQSGLIQVGYLITGLRAAGLQVGPIGGFDAAGIDADLFTDSAWQSLLVLNVGQPAAQDATRPRAPRLAYSDIARSV